MKIILTLLATCCFTLAASNLVVAEEEILAGEITEVTCLNSETDTYWVYLPPTYTTDRAWPILYCFQTMGRADEMLWLYESMAEKEGFIMVGVSGASLSDNDWKSIRNATSAVWSDTEKRFKLTKTMRYAIGFDGAASMAMMTAVDHSHGCSGIILLAPAGGGANIGSFPKETAVFVGVGKDDTLFEKIDLKGFVKGFKDNGNPAKLEKYDGGHTTPEGDFIAKPLRWFLSINAEAKEIAFQSGIEESKKDFAEGRPVVAYERLVGLIDKHVNIRKHIGAARRLRKELLEDPALSDEVSALKLWDKAVKNEEKNKSKFKKKPFAAKTASRKYAAIIKKYPDTPCAKRAQDKVDSLKRYLED